MNSLAQGIEYWKAGELGEAASHIRTFLDTHPEYGPAWANLANVERDRGNVSEALSLAVKALDLTSSSSANAEDRHWIWSNYLMTLNYSDKVDLDALLDAHASWGGNEIDEAAENIKFAFKNSLELERKIHIGFVSGDLRWHSVSFFLLHLFKNLDRDLFELTCFSDNREDDQMTDILRGFSSGWVNSEQMDDQQLLKTIRRSRVDVLFDLAGHTAYNRMAVFAKRAAPIQVSWLGYPLATGNPSIDYWMTDPVVCQFPEWFERTLGVIPLRMQQGSHAYHPPFPEDKFSNERICDHGDDDTVWLGCFNPMAKISTSTLNMWTSILRRSKTTKLLLKGRSFADLKTSENFRNYFADNGIDSSRIRLVPRTETTRGHLESYRHIDIALDTYPYAGTTTTCESLWMGVPVITRKGETPASRVTASILRQIGYEQWVTNDASGYENCVLQLVENIEMRRKFRRSARKELFMSGLTNGQQFNENWTDQIRQVWENYVRSQEC